MSPYRLAAEPPAAAPYRHPDRVWLRRLVLRFIAWHSPRFHRPQCWACGKAFAPRRGADVIVQCASQHWCTRAIEQWAAAGHSYWPAQTGSYLRPRNGADRPRDVWDGTAWVHAASRIGARREG